MERRDKLFGLSPEARARLVERLSSRSRRDSGEAPRLTALPDRLDPAQLAGYREIRLIEAAAEHLGIADPYFRVHDGIAGAETAIDGRRTGLVFFDMQDPSQIPAIAEPLFMALNATIQFLPVMTPEDVQKGIGEAAKAWE